MEEKKKKSKGSLVIIVLLIIVILGLVGYIIFNGNGNINFTKNNSKNVEDKNTKVNKSIDNSETTEISNEEAMAIGEKLYKKAADLYVRRGGSYELTQPDQNGTSTPVCYKLNSDGSFTKAGCSEFMGKEPYYVKLATKDITDVLTKNMLNSFLLEFYDSIKEYNGEYYRQEGDRGGNISYRTSDLAVVKNEGNTITFDLTSYYGVYIDGQEFDKSKADRKLTQSFVIKKEDGTWKVDRFVSIM